MIEKTLQPLISVGIASGLERVDFELPVPYRMPGQAVLPPGRYEAVCADGSISVMQANGAVAVKTDNLSLAPTNGAKESFLIRGVTIGVGFHWERSEDQRFTGALELNRDSNGRLTLINRVSLEDYISSVISSEMNANSPLELLKAHAITSRSWILAQLESAKESVQPDSLKQELDGRNLVRWYDRENHLGFDVCADDHCQRYQGTTKATAPEVQKAIDETFGAVLVSEGRICDARYSKSCGGMTEDFAAAWDEIDVPYLSARFDGDRWPAAYRRPLTAEDNARAWIMGSPDAFCKTDDPSLLEKILPGFDQETVDFYRWSRRLTQDELQALFESKLGITFGAIRSLDAVERGRSSRIIRLRITGERETAVIGKELEIRRALSPSHLYSSAFVVERDDEKTTVPKSFMLTGAGWGHGVGLCQIGAAVMAEKGIDSATILRHYFQDSDIVAIYRRDG